MSLLFALLATAAAVQPPADAPAPPLAGPPVASVSTGVTIYPPAFFTSAQPTSALDMINRIPGFSYDSGDSVRGFAGAASNVLIDGARPASKSDTTDSILSRIPASDVDHIELIRGGAPGIDMQGRTVMANVIRKKGSTSKITASVQDNLFADGHTIPGGSLLYSGRFGPRTIDLGLSRYSSFDDSVGDGRYTVIPANGPQTSQNARTAGHGGGVGITGAYSGPDLGGQLRANVKIEETYFNNGLSYGLPPTVVVNDHSRGRDGEVGVTYERKLGAYDVALTGLQHLERDSATEVAIVPGDNGFFGQNQRSGESILRATVRHAVNPNLNVEVGGEGVYNFLVSNERYIDNGANIALPSANVTVDETRGELFGQATWKINPKLRLEAGARFEYSTIEESGDTSKSRSFFYAKPRLLLTWDPYTNTEVRLRVERKLGQLNFSNFVSQADLKNSIVNAGNPDLRPDQHWQFEAALEQRFWGKGSIVITGLHEELTDVSDYTPLIGSNPPIDGPGNIGSGTSDQLDIEGTVPLDRLGIPGAQLKTTTIWRISSVTDPVTHQERRISGQRPDVLQGTFQQDLPALKSTWSLTYFKGWRETYYRLGEIDRYHIGNQFVELEWDYKPTSDLLIVAQLDNFLPFKFYRHRTVWDGSRAAAPVDFDDYRTIQSQPRLYLKVRKTF
jgi:hypothetical protein